ncbi:hypothetical protein [Spirochaeta isovalerica]|uniref:Fimbrial protein n=1 Tax=Spirochaeta isovalerica TaxID=150 RepID=A0A841RCC8_9SPIO|nr:hypothetical protein [Spirochaeta isovalerica]MBB6481041.1 hypothetical protein [Spirochaeta isovalerica]
MKFILTLAVAAFISLPAMADTTGTLTLTGTVDSNMAIVVTPVDGVYNDLDLLNDASNLKVATVTEISNSAYTVTVSSDNSSELAGPSDSLAYTLTYDGASIDLTSGSAVITNTTTVTDADGLDKDLNISYTGNPALPSGTYTDTLTFTIAAP